MFFSSSIYAIAGIFIIAIFISIVSYCVRVNRAHRHISAYPMQVVVIARPNPEQPEYPQMCWTVPLEQPPPPYNAVVDTMNPNYQFAHYNNGS
jgi:hypothetical protein